MSEQTLSVLIAFAVGAAFGYWIAPDNWYEERVSACLTAGMTPARECFMGVAEWDYDRYIRQPDE